MDHAVIIVSAYAEAAFEGAAQVAVKVATLAQQDIAFVFDGVRLVVGATDTVASIRERWQQHRDAE